MEASKENVYDDVGIKGLSGQTVMQTLVTVKNLFRCLPGQILS